MRAVLERAGYQVLEVLDGEHGLQVVRQLDLQVDLLVSDLQMPRMGGNVLAATLRITYPTLRVLYVTGHADMVELAETDAVLLKPFTPGELVRRVREIVQTEPARMPVTSG